MSEIAAPARPPAPRGAIARALDSDIFYSFRSSPIAVAAAIVFAICVFGAAFASWIAPHNPFNVASLSLLDSFKPPAFVTGGEWSYVFGTDDQGRDMLSAIMYGARLSLMVGISSVLFAVVVGVSAGLLAGYSGGWLDTLLMRAADVQLTFQAFLVALLVDGVVGAVLPHDMRVTLEIYVLIFAIGIAQWPQFARIVRGSTLVERNKDYVLAARVIGLSRLRIMATHVLPNVLGPVLIVATLNLGLAIITEATLSFLGLGLPPTEPSLGTLINNGDNFLFSGDWWMVVFPGLALVLLVLSINLLGDWLRDALNPKLR
jgi:peptide/nickel transport system permease protein